MILYVVHEMPTTSQTFVEREIAALRRAGVRVEVYALNTTTRASSVYDVQSILPSVGNRRLVTAFGRSPCSASAQVLGATLRGARPLAQSMRLVVANAHARRILEWIKQKPQDRKPTRVHAHFLARTADVAALIAVALDVPLTVTAHASDAFASREPELMRFRLAIADTVACASRYVRQALVARYPHLKTEIIRCGVDFGKIPEAKPGAGRLVTVGRLVSTKGYLTAIEASGLISPGCAQEWCIIGEGPLRRKMEAELVRSNLASMRLLGARSSPDTLRIVAAASLFVLPCEQSRRGDSDGLPVALLEAMAIGVPCISTPVAGIPELIEHDRNGMLVPQRDPGSLAHAIEALITDPSRRDGLAEAARQTVQQDYDIDLIADRLIRRLFEGAA